MDSQLDLSVVLPAHREGANLALLLPQLCGELQRLRIRSEVLVIVRGADPDTRAAAQSTCAQIIEQEAPGYGGALRAGFAHAKGGHVLTMDADLSHRPEFIADLWNARRSAELLIASRYVPSGSAAMPLGRLILSRLLNRIFARGLSLPIRDMSSGFRLYAARALHPEMLQSHHFDILQEILVKAYADGWRVREIPFRYQPRATGSSNARVIPFGVAYATTFYRLWRLRNSILSADYDDRAFDSPIFLQRYWQRERYRIIVEAIPRDTRTLDVGCGSSRIIAALPRGSVALDILLRKLRYARRFHRLLVQGSGFSLPFRDGAFACIVCSQVIEHAPKDAPILDELRRVLTPGGRLILGTPDYGGWQWPLIEAAYATLAPGAYADEHITHYTRGDLTEEFCSRGYQLEAVRYILGAELVLVFRKPAAEG